MHLVKNLRNCCYCFKFLKRMLYEWFYPSYRKFIAAIIIVFILEYSGIVLQLFEWDFNKYFHLFLEDNTTTEKSIMSFNYVHNPVEKCNEKELALVFLIKSAISHADRRDVIRRTWGNEQRFPHVHFRSIFLLGHTEEAHLLANIDMEAAQHKDIVQADFRDTYYNNTLKSFMAMRWANEHCPHAKFYMMVDDDYYVSTKNLIRFIAHPACYPAKDGIFGYDEDYKELYAGFVYVARPKRDRTSKWYISLEEYPFNKWPPYVSGGAFVLSNDTFMRLFKECLKTRLFRFDDIFLAIAAYKANITLTHCDLFHIEKPEYTSPHSMKYSIASHEFSNPMELEQVWKECRAAGFA